MKTITIHDAKTNLSKYIAAAKQGKKIYIGSFGKPEVRLLKLSDFERIHQGKRSFIVVKGKIKSTPEAFSASTENELTALMLGTGHEYTN